MNLVPTYDSEVSNEGEGGAGLEGDLTPVCPSILSLHLLEDEGLTGRMKGGP